jgi:hypothetical protein
MQPQCAMLSPTLDVLAVRYLISFLVITYFFLYQVGIALVIGMGHEVRLTCE